MLIASIRVPTVSDIGGAIFPEILSRTLSFISCDNIELRVFIEVIVGQWVNV